jgi:hypothetical protein
MTSVLAHDDSIIMFSRAVDNLLQDVHNCDFSRTDLMSVMVDLERLQREFHELALAQLELEKENDVE